MHDNITDTPLLQAIDVARLLGMNRTAFHKMAHRGDFIAPVQTRPIRRWRFDHIEDYLQGKLRPDGKGGSYRVEDPLAADRPDLAELQELR